MIKCTFVFKCSLKLAVVCVATGALIINVAWIETSLPTDVWTGLTKEWQLVPTCLKDLPDDI